MADTPPIPAAVVSASEVSAYSISEDGTTALIQFKDDDDQLVALTLPVNKLGSLLSVVVNARRLADKKDIPAGHVQFTVAQSYSVGNVSGYPNSVLLGFDGGLVTEAMIIIDDKPAMGMAEAIKSNVLKRVTRATAPAPKIILPPGFKQQ